MKLATHGRSIRSGKSPDDRSGRSQERPHGLRIGRLGREVALQITSSPNTRYPQFIELKEKARRSGPVDDRALLTGAEPSSSSYELRPDAPAVPDGSVSWAPFPDVWS